MQIHIHPQVFIAKASESNETEACRPHDRRWMAPTVTAA